MFNPMAIFIRIDCFKDARVNDMGLYFPPQQLPLASDMSVHGDLPARCDLSHVFLASPSDELLLQVPCDTLLVRAPEGSADD